LSDPKTGGFYETEILCCPREWETEREKESLYYHNQCKLQCLEWFSEIPHYRGHYVDLTERKIVVFFDVSETKFAPQTQTVMYEIRNYAERLDPFFVNFLNDADNGHTCPTVMYPLNSERKRQQLKHGFSYYFTKHPINEEAKQKRCVVFESEPFMENQQTVYWVKSVLSFSELFRLRRKQRS
jgi:hypothetical protein